MQGTPPLTTVQITASKRRGRGGLKGRKEGGRWIKREGEEEKRETERQRGRRGEREKGSEREREREKQIVLETGGYGGDETTVGERVHW